MTAAELRISCVILCLIKPTSRAIVNQSLLASFHAGAVNGNSCYYDMYQYRANIQIEPVIPFRESHHPFCAGVEISITRYESISIRSCCVHNSPSILTLFAVMRVEQVQTQLDLLTSGGDSCPHTHLDTAEKMHDHFPKLTSVHPHPY
jgi:hypothetical protein